MSKLKEQKIVLLKGARKLVKAKSEEFVCLSLFMVYDYDDKEQHKAYMSLIKYIKKVLKGSYTLTEWQEVRGIVSKDPRKDRIKWMDWMIASLEQ